MLCKQISYMFFLLFVFGRQQKSPLYKDIKGPRIYGATSDRPKQSHKQLTQIMSICQNKLIPTSLSQKLFT